MDLKIILAVAASIVGVSLLGLAAAMAPGGMLNKVERDFSENVDAYCAEGVSEMRQITGFEGLSGTGFPAITRRGERPTFACPARNWRGSYIVRVRGRCALPTVCTIVDTVEDSDGRVVYSNT